MKTMTLHEAIRKASRIGFKTGASVRFAYNQLLGQAHSFSTATKTIYAVLFGKIMFQADQTGGQWSDRYVENREAVGLPMTVAVKAVPSPEPETQEGFNQ